MTTFRQLNLTVTITVYYLVPITTNNNRLSIWQRTTEKYGIVETDLNFIAQLIKKL